MTRSSTPSKRPQTRTAPAPAESASTRACVSGVPRGDNKNRGRAAVGVASMARPSTSAFITMPGPPPARVSSTLRCLSVAKARISTTSSDHAPAASALPARLAPNGPGNMSGKMVSTLARHISMSWSACAGAQFVTDARNDLAELVQAGAVAAHAPISVGRRRLDKLLVAGRQQHRLEFGMQLELAPHGAVHHAVLHLIPVRPDRGFVLVREAFRDR